MPSDLGYCTKQKALYADDLGIWKNRHYPGPLPVLLLKAKLSSPATLCSGERLPLRLFVRNLITPECVGPVLLGSLVVTLQSRIAIVAGIHRTSWTSSSQLLDLKGLKEAVPSSPEDEGLSEINPRIVQSSTIPKAMPSFTACTVEQKYLLEVEAGFTLGNDTRLRVRCATRLKKICC